MDKFVDRLTPAKNEAQDEHKWEACNKAAAEYLQRAAAFAAQPEKAGSVTSMLLCG
jgi:hypothetical protein